VASHTAAVVGIRAHTNLADDKSHKPEDLVVELYVRAFDGIDSKIFNMYPNVDLVDLRHLRFWVLHHR
jgi:hypothetical protein